MGYTAISLDLQSFVQGIHGCGKAPDGNRLRTVRERSCNLDRENNCGYPNSCETGRPGDLVKGQDNPGSPTDTGMAGTVACPGVLDPKNLTLTS